jgi:putative tryptophan/tyrosine transport system substrate-binding protein
MTFVLRRLALGFVLIGLASLALALSDTARRSAEAPGKGAPAGDGALARRWKLDLLRYITTSDVEDAEHGIRRGLADSGLVEGRDFEIRVRSAEGDMPTLGALVDAAMGEGTDMILTLSTPTLQAALRRSRGVPIVYTFVADAILAGAGKTLTDHLPNATGVPTGGGWDEMVALVREILPATKRVGTLFVPAEVNSVRSTELFREAATRAGIEVVAVPANTPAEVADAVLAMLAGHPDAVVQVPSNVTIAGYATIARAARRARVPSFGFLTGDLTNGAMAVMARDHEDAGHIAGTMAARVMRGESPATIPITPLTRSRLKISLDTARAVGVTIPAAVLARADQVVGGRDSKEAAR